MFRLFAHPPRLPWGTSFFLRRGARKNGCLRFIFTLFSIFPALTLAFFACFVYNEYSSFAFIIPRQMEVIPLQFLGKENDLRVRAVARRRVANRPFGTVHWLRKSEKADESAPSARERAVSSGIAESTELSISAIRNKRDKRRDVMVSRAVRTNLFVDDEKKRE